MNRLLLIWRNICYRPLQNGIAVGVMALSIAMGIVVLLLAQSITGGLTGAAEPFPMVVGSKGSPNQLVLNTVFLKDLPMDNIEYATVEKLRSSPLVAAAIPLGFGDNYRGFRIVGTESELFEQKVRPKEPAWLQIESGRSFQHDYEAVLGAATAAAIGLKVGDTFASSHGMVTIAKNTVEHQQKFTVCGILKPLHGPYDQSILIPLTSIWQMHAGHDKKAVVAAADEHEHKEGGVTAIVVKPKGYAQALMLHKEFRQNKFLQLVFPSQTVIELFSILGQGEKLLKSISYAVITLALLIIGCSLYWSALDRRRDQAILRALGARRRDILLLNLGQGITVTLCGLVVGTTLGHTAFFALAQFLWQKTAVALQGTVTVEEAVLLLGTIVLGILFSLIPARIAAAREPAQEL